MIGVGAGLLFEGLLFDPRHWVSNPEAYLKLLNEWFSLSPDDRACLDYGAKEEQLYNHIMIFSAVPGEDEKLLRELESTAKNIEWECPIPGQVNIFVNKVLRETLVVSSTSCLRVTSIIELSDEEVVVPTKEKSGGENQAKLG